MLNNQRLCHATLQIHTTSLRTKSELPSQLTLGQQRRAPSLRIPARKRAQAVWMQSGSDDHLNLRCPKASLEETSQFRTRSNQRSLQGISRGCWPETKSCHEAKPSLPSRLICQTHYNDKTISLRSENTILVQPHNSMWYVISSTW